MSNIIKKLFSIFEKMKLFEISQVFCLRLYTSQEFFLIKNVCVFLIIGNRNSQKT